MLKPKWQVRLVGGGACVVMPQSRSYNRLADEVVNRASGKLPRDGRTCLSYMRSVG